MIGRFWRLRERTKQSPRRWEEWARVMITQEYRELHEISDLKIKVRCICTMVLFLQAYSATQVQGQIVRKLDSPGSDCGSQVLIHSWINI